MENNKRQKAASQGEQSDAVDRQIMHLKLMSFDRALKDLDEEDWRLGKLGTSSNMQLMEIVHTEYKDHEYDLHWSWHTKCIAALKAIGCGFENEVADFIMLHEPDKDRFIIHNKVKFSLSRLVDQGCIKTALAGDSTKYFLNQ